VKCIVAATRKKKTSSSVFIRVTIKRNPTMKEPEISFPPSKPHIKKKSSCRQEEKSMGEGGRSGRGAPRSFYPVRTLVGPKSTCLRNSEKMDTNQKRHERRSGQRPGTRFGKKKPPGAERVKNGMLFKSGRLATKGKQNENSKRYKAAQRTTLSWTMGRGLNGQRR